MITPPIRKIATFAALALMVFESAALAADPAPGSEVFLPGDDRIALAYFDAYEVEYSSAFGRFINQVRPFQTEDGLKISVVNLIHMPQGVIVDHRTIDGASLRMEAFISPYFAWGQEHVTGRMDADGYDWIRVPLDGGEVIRTQGVWDTNGVFDGLGFSPTFSTFLPLGVGARFQIPREHARPDGSIEAVLIDMEFIERESLVLDSGVQCECLILEETDSTGAIHRYWVGQNAPFLFRRHRDIGGPRDFVSEVMSYRPL